MTDEHILKETAHSSQLALEWIEPEKDPPALGMSHQSPVHPEAHMHRPDSKQSRRDLKMDLRSVPEEQARACYPHATGLTAFQRII